MFSQDEVVVMAFVMYGKDSSLGPPFNRRSFLIIGTPCLVAVFILWSIVYSCCLFSLVIAL